MSLSLRWRALAGTGPRADHWWDVLWAAYVESHRHYHGIAHVDRVTFDVEQLLGGHGPSHGLIDGEAVRLAAWFHDVIYDPRASSGANEDASAVLGAEAANDLGFAPARADLVAALIRATSTHSDDTSDASTALLLDADLGVLGASPHAYASYVAGVRAEYADVSDDGWRTGRAAVLRSFLDRPVIYRTARMAGHETQARTNLAAELADLGEPGARLRP